MRDKKGEMREERERHIAFRKPFLNLQILFWKNG